MFRGISLAAFRRTTRGTKILPIPCPAKSSSIVSRDRAPSASGSTVTTTIARIGPSTPWSAHRRGGSYSVISVVTSRSRPPMLRVVVHLDPTCVIGPSSCPLRHPFCHSGMCRGSVTYAKTCSADRATSMLFVIGAITSEPTAHQPLAARNQQISNPRPHPRPNRGFQVRLFPQDGWGHTRARRALPDCRRGQPRCLGDNKSRARLGIMTRCACYRSMPQRSHGRPVARSLRVWKC